jgi:hypothetical protein
MAWRRKRPVESTDDETQLYDGWDDDGPDLVEADKFHHSSGHTSLSEVIAEQTPPPVDENGKPPPRPRGRSAVSFPDAS